MENWHAGGDVIEIVLLLEGRTQHRWQDAWRCSQENVFFR